MYLKSMRKKIKNFNKAALTQGKELKPSPYFLLSNFMSKGYVKSGIAKY